MGAIQHTSEPSTPYRRVSARLQHHCTPTAAIAQPSLHVALPIFTANWSSVNGAIDYRLDVSTSNTFTTYVPGYQNLSVGNVTSFPVIGLSAHTHYYYRVRAYNGSDTTHI